MKTYLGIGILLILVIGGVWGFWSGTATATYNRLLGNNEFVEVDSPGDISSDDSTAVELQDAISAVDINKMNEYTKMVSDFKNHLSEIEMDKINTSYAMGQIDPTKFILEYDRIPSIIEPGDILTLKVRETGEIFDESDNRVSLESLREMISRHKFVIAIMDNGTKVKHTFLIKDACIDLRIPMVEVLGI